MLSLTLIEPLIVGILPCSGISVLFAIVYCCCAHVCANGEAMKIADNKIPIPKMAGIRIFLLISFFESIVFIVE